MTKTHLLLQAAVWALVVTSANAFMSSSATLSSAPADASPQTGTTTTTTTSLNVISSRRSALQDVAKRITVASGIVASSSLIGPTSALAETAMDAAPVEMKLFSDELFVVNIPKRFFALRRRAKGDLPDEKTGQGRRGSSIFR